MQHVTAVMVYDIFSPPQASRVYAYASIAAYETLRQGHPEYATLAGRAQELTPVPAPPAGIELSLPLASVHAFMNVGRALIFSRPRMDSLSSSIEAPYRARLAPEVFTRSMAYGDRVAAHILAWAGTDQYLRTRGAPKFSVRKEPGRWIPTPPAYLDAIEPHWGELRPFLIDSASEFRPAHPPPFDTARSSPFFRQVQEVYDISKRLTDPQRDIAAFWDCNPYKLNVTGHSMYALKKISPGGHWMLIAGLAARKARADMMQSAEAYARTAMALDDAFIVGWKEKYRSNLVRPETVINEYLDEGWQPFLQTPPFPEYLSGHSMVSNAAASVLTDEFGPAFSFDDSSEVAYGLPVRHFESFDAAAAEATISRLYGGIHYRMAVEEGAVVGHKVGEMEVARLHRHGPHASGAQPATPIQYRRADPRRG